MSAVTKEYSLFILYSEWSLDDLYNWMESNLETDSFSDIHIDRTRSRKETNRTVCLMREDVYDDLVNRGYTRRNRYADFWIQRYQIHDYHHPSNGYSSNMYVSLPKEFNLTVTESRQQLQDKIDTLCKFGVLSAGEVTIKIPLVNRESGEPKGGAFIVFTQSVDPNAIAVSKLYIDNSYWYAPAASSTVNSEKTEVIKHSDSELVKCYWARSIPAKGPAKGPAKSKHSAKPKAPSKAEAKTKSKTEAYPDPVSVKPAAVGKSDDKVSSEKLEELMSTLQQYLTKIDASEVQDAIKSMITMKI